MRIEVDAATKEGLELMRRAGCSYQPRTFWPGPGVPHATYPLEISAPAGFHFADGSHETVIQTWAAIVEELSRPLVPCDRRCRS